MKVEFTPALFSGNCFFLMTEQPGCEPEITVHACAASAVGQYLSLYGVSPFSEEAAAFLRKSLSDTAKNSGFLIENPAEPILRYVYSPASDLPGGGDAVLLDASNGYPLSLLLDPGDYLTPDTDRFAAVLRDGAIVSAACASKNRDGVWEITVETNPRYRKKGFASSCASLLAAYLRTKGCCVEYRCRLRNTASAKTAEHAGFVLASKSFALFVKDAK